MFVILKKQIPEVKRMIRLRVKYDTHHLKNKNTNNKKKNLLLYVKKDLKFNAGRNLYRSIKNGNKHLEKYTQ